MNKKQLEAYIWNIKSIIETQSLIALKIDDSNLIDKQVYDKNDLFRVSLLFMHIMWNISASYHLWKWCTVEQAWILAGELWKSLRQTIELHTWIDMHNI